jgi:hypothetical protein
MKYIKTYESKELDEKIKMMNYYTLKIGIALNEFLTLVCDNECHMISRNDKVTIFIDRDTEIFCLSNQYHSISAYIYNERYVPNFKNKFILEYINEIFKKYCKNIDLQYSSFIVYHLDDFTQMENIIKDINNIDNYHIIVDAEKYNL